MDWKLELLMARRAIAAALLGALNGRDRERHALGACVFGLVSSHVDTYGGSRIVAQVVTGARFQGGGVILREKGPTERRYALVYRGRRTRDGLWHPRTRDAHCDSADTLLPAHHLRTPKTAPTETNASRS